MPIQQISSELENSNMDLMIHQTVDHLYAYARSNFRSSSPASTSEPSLPILAGKTTKTSMRVVAADAMVLGSSSDLRLTSHCDELSRTRDSRMGGSLRRGRASACEETRREACRRAHLE